jgi:hypothetical protein
MSMFPASIDKLPVGERFAWRLGYASYNHGNNRNPFPEADTPEHDAWIKGWCRAQRDAQPAKE